MTFDPETKPEESENQEYELVFPKLSHRYRQRGNEVYCTQCPQTHGFWVRNGVKMVGEENGEPVFATVWTLPEDDASESAQALQASP